MVRRALAGLALGVLLATGIVPPVAAAGVVTNCTNDTQLRSKVAAGGVVTFACGTRTILLGSAIDISGNVTIDGGGRITLSGGNEHRLFYVGFGSTLTLRRIALTRGYSSLDAGAIMNDEGTLKLDRTTISYSTADAGSGGAIFSRGGPTTIDHSVLHHNSAANAGAVIAYWEDGDVSITDSVLRDNRATALEIGQGGAIYLHDGADVTIRRSELAGNHSRMGGAIHVGYANSGLEIVDSTLRDNEAIDPADAETSDHGDGGAIYLGNNVVASITRSTLSGNRSVGAYGGGAIENYGADLTLTDVTFSGNHAQSGGGAMEILFGSVTMTNVTFADNVSDDDGNAIYDQSGVVLHLRNVVFSGAGDDCRLGPPPATSSFNLSSDASCGFGSGRDNVALKLGPLDTNGGPTRTHRLLPGSPAIDGGAGSGCPAKDQRGVSRPRGSACDVGAVEIIPCAGRPGAPRLLGPGSGARVRSTRPALDWAGPDCAQTFTVTVRRGTTSGPTAFNKAGLVASRATTGTLARGTYWWRAAACTPAGCTSSSWRKLIVAP